MLRWLRLNGEIIGCEKDGVEYTVYAIMKSEDATLHNLYHAQLKREGTNGFQETDKR